MTKKKLLELLKKAIENEPPESLKQLFGIYYSPYYHLIYLLAESFKNGTFVELGVHQGRGIISMAIPNKTAKIIGIDHTEHFTEVSLATFKNTIFLERDSLPISDEIQSLGKTIKILHIDTEHSYSMAKAEFEAYEPYLNPPAVVLFDDLHAQNNGVRKYFRTLDHWKYEDDRLHPSCGYGVLLYE